MGTLSKTIDYVLRHWALLSALTAIASALFCLGFFKYIDYRFLFSLSLQEALFVFLFNLLLLLSIVVVTATFIPVKSLRSPRRFLVRTLVRLRMYSILLLLFFGVIPVDIIVRYFSHSFHGSLGARMRADVYIETFSLFLDGGFVLASSGLYLLLQRLSKRRGPRAGKVLIFSVHWLPRAIFIFCFVVAFDLFRSFGSFTALFLYGNSRQAAVRSPDNVETKGKVFIYTGKGIILAEDRARLIFLPYDQISSLRYVQSWDWVRTSPKFSSPPWARKD